MTKINTTSLTAELTKVRDNASANGKDANRVSLSITRGGQPAEGIRVVFNVDGNAIFVNNRSGVYSAESDSHGLITLDFIDELVENVNLTSFIVEQKEETFSAEFNFVAAQGDFKIDRVQTKNQTLYYNEPTIIWDGASFILMTSCGSGEVTWEISGEDREGIRLESDEYGSAEVTAISAFVGVRSITARDKSTGETATHAFNITHYIEPGAEKITLLDAVQNKENNPLLPKSALRMLYDQWGDLSSYNGWLPNTFYWSDEYKLSANTAWSFNDSTGIFVEDSYQSFGVPSEQGYVYSKKS